MIAAEEHDDAGRSAKAGSLVLGMQADMYDPAAPPSELTAFAPIKARIAQRSAEFAKPVPGTATPCPAPLAP